ncbi:MAG: class I SAM-dependent methyltransferase [Sulfuritalea sp.]|nr:class I SAM-dependent methyltransferase [Sulfuritalea sp.]
MKAPTSSQRPADSLQQAQDDEYAFPYHYVTRMPDRGFRQHFVDTWGINYISTIEFLLGRIRAGAHETLVDVGCGDGRLTREIALGTGIARVCGVDYSARAIGLARAMNQDLQQIEFRREDITGETGLGGFDAAVLMEVFEHVHPDEAEAFIRGVRRLLKPQGRLHLTVPHTNKPVEYKHFRHFTADGLIACLKPDFDIVEVVPFERIGGTRRRLLNGLLYNRYFVLNDQRVLSRAYRWYMKNLFHCDTEGECQRIYLEAVAR